MGAGLWAQAVIRGAFCVLSWQRTGFCYNPFYAAQIRLLGGVRRMAKEAFTAAGETEEGAEVGCEMARVCKYTLLPAKCKER